MKKIFLLLTFILTGLGSLMAQSSSTMEEYMYSSGKIWVAIIVLGLILVLIFLYLWRMDKKISRLEEDSR